MIYTYRCPSCGAERDLDFPMGEAKRLVNCPVAACGGTAHQVLGQVQIAPSALETKGAAVRASNEKDRALSDDMTSYKRMRARGLQPEHIDGVSKIENEVNDNFDLKHRARLEKALPDEPYASVKERALEAMEVAKTGSWSPV